MSENKNTSNCFESNDLEKFKEKISSSAFKPIKTNEPIFDNLTTDKKSNFGGVYRQSLNIIMSMQGIGKTTFCQQIAESLASQGIDVLFYNFEMSKEQLIAKDVCRIMNRKEFEYKSAIRKDNNKVMYDFINPQEVLTYNYITDSERLSRKQIDDAIESYQVINHHLKYITLQEKESGKFNNELSALIDEIESTANSLERQGKQAPGVFIDYLQLLDGNMNDVRESIKSSVLRLKQYAVKHNTFVFVISAVNRDASDSGKIKTTSGRDSSNIEYTGDTIITLNYKSVELLKDRDEIEKQIQVEKKEVCSRMTIHLLKNRFGEQNHGEFFFYQQGGFFTDWEQKSDTDIISSVIASRVEDELSNVKAEFQSAFRTWGDKRYVKKSKIE